MMMMFLLNPCKTILLLLLFFNLTNWLAYRFRHRQYLGRLFWWPNRPLSLSDSLSYILRHLVLALQNSTDFGPRDHELHPLHEVDFEKVLLMTKVLDGLDVDGNQLVKELSI